MKTKITTQVSAILRFASAPLLIFTLFSLFSPMLFAQDTEYEPYEVEDVTSGDFSIENEIIDENTKAVYLYDIGDSNVKISSREATLEFTRSFRLQILSEQGLDLADQMVQLYVGSKAEEKIGRVKGGVYNLVDDKVVFEKLKNKDWSVEEYDARTKLARMRFKNVMVGSIIELSYTVFSPFLVRMPDWDFQYNDIPVLYSEYSIRYPKILAYKILQVGYHPLFASLHTSESVPDEDAGVSIRYIDKEVYILACKNVPKMRPEPFMDSPENYRTKVITELLYVDFPDIPREYYYKDWQGSLENFIDEYNCGQYLNPKDRHDYFMLDTVACENLADSIQAIYNHIRKSYTNSEARNYLAPRRSPRQVLDAQKATWSEINWILVATLRVNGIDAYPVLASIRSRPRILKFYPIFSQFSSSLTAVKGPDHFTLLDVTSPVLKPGEISDYYHNGDGLVVRADTVEWIPIEGNTPTKEKCVIEFTQQEGNVLSGKMQLQLSGVYRTRNAKELSDGDYTEFVQDMPLVRNAEVELNEEESNFDSSPMDLHFDIKLTLEKFGDSYLLPALIYDDKADNKLKDKKRTYPVNYIDKWEDSYTCVVHLDPEKYAVTLPENSRLTLPNTDAQFSFIGSYNFGTLVIRSKMNLNKATFEPVEYPTLRKFYDMVSTTHSSFIEISAK